MWKFFAALVEPIQRSNLELEDIAKIGILHYSAKIVGFFYSSDFR